MSNDVVLRCLPFPELAAVMVPEPLFTNATLIHQEYRRSADHSHFVFKQCCQTSVVDP
jgi:hypothetical protein